MSPAKSICVLPLRNFDAMLKCRIAMSMAGAEAEAFLHGERHDDEGGDSDMLEIQKCVEMASGPLDWIDCAKRAKAHAQASTQIEAIALALQERETLTEGEVKTIMNRS